MVARQHPVFAPDIGGWSDDRNVGRAWARIRGEGAPAKVSMPKVAAVLRHSNPRITADVYAGLVETGRAELAVDLAAAFGQRGAPAYLGFWLGDV